jgi:mRNA-degrading endonuclease RelE of RelBE toxin-antitoxin system
MKYRRAPKFKKSVDKLPDDIKKKVQKAFDLFQKDPNHPSLRIKKMEGLKDTWEGRINIQYRFIFEYGEDEIIFLNIGPHDVIDEESRKG